MDAKQYRAALLLCNTKGITLSQALKEVDTHTTTENDRASPKEKRRNNHKETDLQRDCVSWFRTVYPKYALNLFHPNNEPYFGNGKTKEQQQRSGYLAKTIGVTSGVADLILLVPNKSYHGLCIELKWENGKQRDTQKIWQNAVECLGYKYEIVRTIFEFKRLITEYINDIGT